MSSRFMVMLGSQVVLEFTAALHGERAGEIAREVCRSLVAQQGAPAWVAEAADARPELRLLPGGLTEQELKLRHLAPAKATPNPVLARRLRVVGGAR